MITQVVLVRHGRTHYNAIRRLQGQIDIPLDIVGQWQADQTGMALAQRYYWAKVADTAQHPERLTEIQAAADGQAPYEDWKHSPSVGRRLQIVSSDLTRALQTAHACADILGLPVIADARMRERSFGQWEGHTRAEIEAMAPEGYRRWKAHEDVSEFGVESREACGMRGLAALESYLNDELAPSIRSEQSYQSSNTSVGTENQGAELNVSADANSTSTTDTTLVVFGHGSWIATTIERMLHLEHGASYGLGNIRNASWATLTPHYAAQHDGTWHWRLDEININPYVLRAGSSDEWEQGPRWLHS